MMSGEAMNSDSVLLRGEVSRLPSNPTVRALLAMSGLLLLRGIAALFVRYCLGVKGMGTFAVKGKVVRVETDWQLFGRSVRRAVTEVPSSVLTGIRRERRTRILYAVVGFGALTTGVLVGTQWLLDGLHAGYPYLIAAGAFIVAAGVAVDVFLYIFVPSGEGRQRVLIALGPWMFRVSGVDADAVEKFTDAVHTSWNHGNRPA